MWKNKVAKMISFVLAGLEIEMTALEASSFEMLAKILVEIPNANIYTLLDIIADKQHIEPYYDRLPENVRQWLKTQYDSDGVERSRKGTAQKIWSIVNSDMIGDLLTGDRNTFDPARLLNARKTIVITIDKKVVLENTSVIARCFIASLVSAMWARSLPITNEPGWRFIFDEFKDIVGPKDNSQPRSVLEQGREFDVSCQIAHQQIDQQLGNDMASTVVTNTHINAYANIDPKDARRIAPKLGVRTEDLLNFSKTEQYGYFCLWINGYIPKGVKCRVRFGHMQARPRLPDEHFRELVEAHRSFWARVNNKVQRVTPLRAVQDGDDAKLVHLVRDDQPKSMANVPWMQ